MTRIFIFLSYQIFGGVGIACLPLGLIFAFIRRPKAVITRSQYIKVPFVLCTVYSYEVTFSMPSGLTYPALA